MKTVTLKGKGGHKGKITFKKGGLHLSLHVAQNDKIPLQKMRAALKGKYGKKAASQARFAKNVLTKSKTK